MNRGGVFPIGTLLLYAPAGAVELAWIVVDRVHVAVVKDPFAPVGSWIRFPPTLRGWGHGWEALPPMGYRLHRSRGPEVSESWDFHVDSTAV